MKNASIECTLDAWIEACRERPGELPPGVEPVQTRWIRAVGRGELPDGAGGAFVKVMGFPRCRDRLRYIHRALPCVHEAEMLGRVAGLGMRCPEPLRVVGERRWGRVPQLSVLITAEVESALAPVRIERAAEVAVRLADGGVFHPDLNRGNFLAPPTAATGLLPAVLDLQSARFEGVALAPAQRRQMAIKLIVEFGIDGSSDADLDALVESGLIRGRDVAAVRSAAAIRRIADLRRRIQRCMRNSTEFVIERRFGRGRVHWRRAVRVDGQSGAWCSHPRAVALWLGDRAREVLDGEPPILGALFHKSLWFPGESSVYIAGADGRKLSTVQAESLLEGYSRLQRLAIDDRG